MHLDALEHQHAQRHHHDICLEISSNAPASNRCRWSLGLDTSLRRKTVTHTQQRRKKEPCLFRRRWPKQNASSRLLWSLLLVCPVSPFFSATPPPYFLEGSRAPSLHTTLGWCHESNLDGSMSRSIFRCKKTAWGGASEPNGTRDALVTEEVFSLSSNHCLPPPTHTATTVE